MPSLAVVELAVTVAGVPICGLVVLALLANASFTALK